MTLRQYPPDAPHSRQARQPDVTAEPRHPLAVPIGGLVLLAVLTPLHGSWAVQLLLVPLLLIVPGVIFLRTLRVSGNAIALHPVYLPAASVLVLMGSGLAIDLIGPLMGISAPLRTAPLLIALEVVCVVLLACSLNAPPETEIPWSSLPQPAGLAWPLLIPLLSAAGALRLNSGHSNHVAMIAVVVVIIALLAGFLLAPWCENSLLLVIVFAAALGMMWSFSLRGDLVYGFDISNEYYSLNQTVTAGVWHVSHPNDAYGAMLSVTVLPAELHALSGVSALLTLKVVYPLIGALFPVGVFCLARRVLAGRWAFMAAALVVMQETFFQELPALARQEVAMLLFAALILAVLDRSQSLRTRWTFVCLLSLGMVVSHYSTAYMAIPLLAIAAALQWLASWIRPVPRITGAVLLACVVSVAGATVWYGSLTDSSSNVSQFVQAAQGQGIDLLPNQGGNLLTTYLQGESEQEMTPAQYQNYISSFYKTNDKFITPLPDASEPQYALKSVADPTPPVTWNMGAQALNLFDLLIQQLLNLLAGVGALVMVVFRRKVSVIARQIGLLGLAGMAILLLVRISGTIAAEYNPQRAFLQALIVLAICICWIFQRLGARWKQTRAAILIVCAASVGLFMVGSSGIAGAVLGGGTASNLANSYDDYQQFVMTAPEIAAAAWVNEKAPIGQLIYADHYAELRMNTVAGNRTGVFDAITPETLDQHAWVYADRTNVVDNIVHSLTGTINATYAFPKSFLNSNFNVVYTNGTSEVFHR